MDSNVTQVEEIVAQFYDETFNVTKAFYDVQITVKTRLYDSGAEYYDIAYKYKFHPMELETPDDISYFQKVIHPFFQEDQQGKYGEIIKKNKMTACMIEFLLKPDDELTKDIIGMSSPQRYRSDIIHSLAKLWD